MEQTIAYEAVETRVLVDGAEIRRLRILAGLLLCFGLNIKGESDG